MPTIETPIEKWTGKINEVILGGNSRKKVIHANVTIWLFLPLRFLDFGPGVT